MTGAYSYQIGTPPVPQDVTGLVIYQTGPTITLTWDNSTDSSTIGYNIYYGRLGNPFASAELLTDTTRATEITTSKVPPGSYTFYIVGVDLAGQTSENYLSYDFVVANNNTIIFDKTYVPNFQDEAPSGFRFHRHWTGVMVPMGQFTCDVYTQDNPPDIADITLDQVAGGSFDAMTYYVTATFVTDGGETLPSAEQSINVDAGYLPTVFISRDAYPTAVHGWNVYVDTISGSETQQNTTTQGNTNEITGGSKIDQIWQMPISGLIAGNAQPTQNTTGWEVFNKFIPDFQNGCAFVPPEFTSSAGIILNPIDTGANANARVSFLLDLIPGPGESGIAAPYNTNGYRRQLQYGSTAVNTNVGGPLFDVTTTIIPYRYLYPYVTAFMQTGNVFYINKMEVIVDNAPQTYPLNNVAVSSAGTTVNFATNGLAFHAIPTVQVTPSSSLATSGTATAVTSSAALITLYNGVGVAVASAANLSITGI